MAASDKTDRDERNGDWVWDDVYLNARKEAWIILGFWVAALIWCVPVCYWLGYDHPGRPHALTLVWGLPTWLFWGVALPWGLAIIASTWFCFRVMKDDSLDVDPARIVTPDAEHPADGDPS